MNNLHFKKLEQMYRDANINKKLYKHTKIKISGGKTVIHLEVTDRYHHALGAMHGSVYFKMLDDAAYFAVSSVVEDVFILTTSFNLHFLRPVRKGNIRTEGRLKFKSKKLFVGEAHLFDEHDNEIAFGTGNFIRSRTELSPEIGYRLQA